MMTDRQESQSQTLAAILANHKNTDYGRRYGFEKIKTARQFRDTLPVACYDDYAPLITLMRRLGERDIFTSDKILCYILSFDSEGAARFIPCTQRYMDLYGAEPTVSALGRMLAPGRVFFLNAGYPTLRRFNDDLFLNSFSGGLLAKHAERIFGENAAGGRFTCPEALVYSRGMFDHRYIQMLFALAEEDVRLLVAPYAELITDSFLFLENRWEMLADDIEAGIIARHDGLPEEFQLPESVETKLTGALKPNPERASGLRAVFKEGFERPIACRIWPRLAFVVTQGCGAAADTVNDRERLTRYTGGIPIRDTPYFSAEALIGSSVAGGLNEYTLLPHAGFFEFAPVRNGVMDMSDTLLMDELSVGGEYGIIITNCLGFYRYNMNDTVRVLGPRNGTPVVGITRRNSVTACFAGIGDKERSIRTAERESSVTTARYY
jgi:hypothetical protein